jgi:hypothetical protein
MTTTRMTNRLLTPLLLLACALAFGACGSSADEPVADEPDATEAAAPAPSATTNGAEVDAARALPVEAVVADVEAYDGQPVTVEGRITEVCQMKGCWLAMDAGDGTPVRILTERKPEGGYVFTVPTDVSGRHAVVHGTLAVETVSAEERRHLAEDGGAAKAEAQALDAAPEVRLTARGVRIQDDASAS